MSNEALLGQITYTELQHMYEPKLKLLQLASLQLHLMGAMGPDTHISDPSLSRRSEWILTNWPGKDISSERTEVYKGGQGYGGTTSTKACTYVIYEPSRVLVTHMQFTATTVSLERMVPGFITM